ncbi:MAG: TrbI/VirB10 family protein [Symploca sp. SIO1A3]|nr:TrbI/VirB10 family protein [Symploca sp. SIO1A3]
MTQIIEKELEQSSLDSPEAVESQSHKPLPSDSGQSEDQWDEKRLAALLGFDDEIGDSSYFPTSDSDQDEEPVVERLDNPISQADLFEDPHATKTQPTLSSNPWAKSAVVGLGLLVFFGAAGFFLAQIMGAKIPRAPSIVKEKEPLDKDVALDETEPAETGVLKTQLALASQEKQMKAVEESRRPNTKIELAQEEPEKPAPTPVPSPQKVASPAPAPPPRRVPRSAPPRPVPRPTPPVAPPTPAFSKPVAAPSPSPHPQPTVAETPVAPMEQWLTLSSLGSYGSSFQIEEAAAEVEAAAQQSTSPPIATNQMPRATIASTFEQKAGELPVQEENSLSASRSKTSSPATLLPPPQEPPAQINPAEEASILNGTPIQRLRVGQQVSAQLVTPIIWAGEGDSSESGPDERFVVQLEQPLTDEEGQELLAAGTNVVFVCRLVHESGLVISEAIALITDGTEYTLPPGAISIRGYDGQPLVADYWDDGGSQIARRDRTAFLFGAFSKVGEVLNRPDTQQSTTSNSSGFSQSTTTTTSGEPNILGAVLEGGFTPLAQQIIQRNEEATQELLNRPKLWYVQAGVWVQVFVNQSFEL